MTLSKFSEIKEMANLMSDEDIKFAETLLRNIQTEVKNHDEQKIHTVRSLRNEVSAG